MDNLQNMQCDEHACVEHGETVESISQSEENSQTSPQGAELQMQALQEEISALRTELEAERTARINERNARMSAGRIGGSENQYFSPDEVRAMSQSEVHANYKKILESMKKWN